MRLLLAVHGYPPSSCGGTETYVADLAQALARQPGVDVAVMAREGDPLRAELAVRTERRGAVDVHFINNTFQVCESFEDSYRNPALQEVASALIDEIAPDVAPRLGRVNEIFRLKAQATNFLPDLTLVASAFRLRAQRFGGPP
ncbi:MAG: hypothetical protein DMF85_18575 [Acidobacteria bacterium]|nr:MAG: hypothetical protein DMF85_18575 [Acidobacteriota bacterium]